jgi:hypothetical protein
MSNALPEWLDGTMRDAALYITSVVGDDWKARSHDRVSVIVWDNSACGIVLLSGSPGDIAMLWILIDDGLPLAPLHYQIIGYCAVNCITWGGAGQAIARNLVELVGRE